MKKASYTYRNKIPKKKLKRVIPAEPKEAYRASLNQPRSSLNRRKKRLKPHSRTLSLKSTNQLPIIILISSIMFMILAIPTMIVVPFVKPQEPEGESINIEWATEEAQDSLFSVAVKRVSAEKVDHVPLETYVTRVIASEMPADFEMEALKAQGIAARTYIVNHLMYQSEHDSAEITDTVQHQVYKDEEELRKQWGQKYHENMERLTEAVHATKGQIITYNQQPITPAFFSTSNGYTENAEDYWENALPYLKSVASPWDVESPKYLNQQIFTIAEVEKALGITLPKDRSIDMEITRTESQRVKELHIAGHSFSGREVREKLGLPSSDFTIKQQQQHLVFTTKGYGHGIGMSQYGANGMAKEGKTYEDIIKYYYQGVEIMHVKDVAPMLVAN